MSFSATPDIKEQVKQATDIVDLIGADMPLRRQGRMFVALCPWHADSRPSLQVNPDRQTWRCWVCDIGGDAFSYVMQRESGISFREALEMLAERAGIPLSTHGRKITPGSPDDKNTLYKAMAWAEDQLHRCLLESPEAEPARDYLHKRGIDHASIVRYHIGFWPNQSHWLMDRSKTTSYSPQILEAVDLVGRGDYGYYDRFSGRVIFSIRDAQSRPIALGGRILPEFAKERSAKYINSRETRLFTKSEHLYGLDLARERAHRSRQIVVMEGYTDVVIARQFGLENCVAVLGTALGAKHLSILRRYADCVILVLDGDDAGQRRAGEVLELFIASQLELRIVTLPEGLDPCDFLLQRGAEALAQEIENAVEALEHHVRKLTTGFNPAHDTQRANRALEEILLTISKAPRLSSETTSALRLREQQTLSRLARTFVVDESALRDRLAELRRKQTSFAQPPQGSAAGAAVPAGDKRYESLSGWDRELFIVLLQNPTAISVVMENVAADDLANDTARQLLGWYCELEAQGELPDLACLLNHIDSPGLKNILVELEDDRERREAVDAKMQLSHLLDAYRRRQLEAERRGQLLRLEQRQLNDKEELELLTRLIEGRRDEP